MAVTWILTPVPVSGESNAVEITILHTTDLHGRFLPGTDYDGNEDVGGLGRLATLIRQYREGNPNCILVDNGDSLQGSVAGYETSGSLVVDALNHLDCRIWNLGNHEFDWGIKTLARNITRFSNTVLSANTHWIGAQPSPFESVKPFVIHEIGGRRIAFTGVNHPKIPFWSRPVLMRDAVIESPKAALLRIMPKIRKEKPDAVILLAHLGYYTDSDEYEEWLEDIIELFPDIDVIIGGHTHRAVASTPAGNALYTQAGYHGTQLGAIRLVFDGKTGSLTGKSAQLHPVGPDVKTDPAFKQFVETAVTMILTQQMKKICYINGILCNEIPVDRESPEQTLIVEAIADAVHADIVFHGAFHGGDIISNETMTAADVFNIVPYENRIVYASLKPVEITRVLDGLIDWWATPRFAFPYGLQAVIDTNGFPGERVKSIKGMNGHILDPEKRYKVAFNSYMAASGGKRFLSLRSVIDSKDAGVTVSDISTREAVSRFLAKKTNYTPHIVTSISHALPEHVTIQELKPVKRPGPVKITAFCRGNNGSNTWFSVKNTGRLYRNIKGYSFSDKGTTIFRIGKDLVLAPGEQVVFCDSIAKHAANTNLYEPYQRVINYRHQPGQGNPEITGDILVLRNPDGTIADSVVSGFIQ
jgi:5'-nucleotidase